jgi:hypothetical protein
MNKEITDDILQEDLTSVGWYVNHMRYPVCLKVTDAPYTAKLPEAVLHCNKISVNEYSRGLLVM